MFNARDCKTGHLFDKWAYMGPKRRKLLDDSWAGVFRKEILPEQRWYPRFGQFEIELKL